MKILFDHHLFYYKYGGASKYFVMLMKHLPRDSWQTTALWPDNEYARSEGLFPTIKKRFKGEDVILERLNRPYTKMIVERQKFDVMHQTDFDNYFYAQLGNKPLVVTYHDSNMSTYDPHPKIADRQRIALKRADAIIVVSNNTKKDLLNLFNVNEKKVHVIYHGIEIPKLERYKADRIINEPYFLFVGRRSKYKNFTRLIYAFSMFYKAHKEVNLVCTSQDFTKEEVQLFSTLGIESKVKSIKASERDIVRLYRDAIALVFPSYYEGFGMPILEAWSCHCPVLLSHASCFPEIAGEAGLYFDPNSVEEMTNCMLDIYEGSEFKQKLIKLGDERVKKFSWSKCAEEHLKVYNQLL